MATIMKYPNYGKAGDSVFYMNINERLSISIYALIHCVDVRNTPMSYLEPCEKSEVEEAFNRTVAKIKSHFAEVNLDSNFATTENLEKFEAKGDYSIDLRHNEKQNTI